jgi:hypothetical protein
MLSLRVLPTLPMVAVSANHSLRCCFRRPMPLYVARDADPAGDAAMASLCNRAEAAGIEVGSLLPCFDDFNEDLRRLGVDRLRTSVGRQLAPQDLVRFLALATAATG